MKPTKHDTLKVLTRLGEATRSQLQQTPELHGISKRTLNNHLKALITARPKLVFIDRYGPPTGDKGGAYAPVFCPGNLPDCPRPERKREPGKKREGPRREPLDWKAIDRALEDKFSGKSWNDVVRLHGISIGSLRYRMKKLAKSATP
jgi:hypothetical protein